MRPAALTAALLLVHACQLAVHGADTVSKQKAETRIRNSIGLKATACGILAPRAVAVAMLGNAPVDPPSDSLLPAPREDDDRDSILYETGAVDSCVRALDFMPCPAGRPNTLAFDSDFVEIVVLTRLLHCTFRPVNFLEFREPLEGRLF